MAHSKSALKRWRQSLERRARNRSVKSRTRTLLIRALSAINADPSGAEEAVRAAVSALDRTAQKGVIHAIRNTGDLDEAPGAYKDIDVVMENQRDLVDIAVELTPLAVIKG